MRSSKEIAGAVFRARDAYLEQQRVKNRRIQKAVAISATTYVLGLTVAGAGYWKFMREQIPVVPKETESTTNTSGTEYLSDEGDSTSMLETTVSSAQSEMAEDPWNTVTSVATEITSVDIRTTPFAEQTETIVSTDIPQTEVTTSSTVNHWCMFYSWIVRNGVTYYADDVACPTAYTKDQYIGKVGDFVGEYKDDLHYDISPDDSVYTVKETETVLFVIKDDGKIVVLCSPEWSLERFEPERLDPSYVDPAHYEELVVIN